MSKPVYLLTVQGVDKIYTKYDQLDSGKFGAVDTPVFNAEACKLTNLFAHMSQLCQ